MDYRHRKYYLVSIPYFSRDMRIRYFKIAAPSMKMHAPYNHMSHKQQKDILSYDGLWSKEIGLRRPDMMISCKTEDVESIEYELRKMVRNDEGHGWFYELTKNFCGQ